MKRKDLRQAAIKRDGLKCTLCGKDCSKPKETGWVRPRKNSANVDHKIPLWLGGSDSAKNVRVLCEDCHKLKTKLEAKLRKEVKRKEKKRLEHERKMKGK